MAEAHGQARALMFKVSQEAKAAAEERNRAIGAELTKQISAAEQRIAAARDDAMASLSSIAADAAQDAAARIAGIDVSKGDADAAVGTAMKGSA